MTVDGMKKGKEEKEWRSEKMKENVQPRGGEETRPKAATNEEARF